MFAEAQVKIYDVKRPIVPLDAVDKRGKQNHVFVAVKGEVQDRIVQLGSSPSPGMVAIVRGLAVGEQVVRKARGNPQITDGLRIEGGK
jgi:multidrug efflux pump subunit AcrA (membrane-fusion protein)